jgi:hypothetical protein
MGSPLKSLTALFHDGTISARPAYRGGDGDNIANAINRMREETILRG